MKKICEVLGKIYLVAMIIGMVLSVTILVSEKFRDWYLESCLKLMNWLSKFAGAAARPFQDAVARSVDSATNTMTESEFDEF